MQAEKIHYVIEFVYFSVFMGEISYSILNSGGQLQFKTEIDQKSPKWTSCVLKGFCQR
jgi:hypothetical protein